MKNHTTLERKSDCELVVTRTVDAPARLVYRAWTTPELFARWWVPRSIGVTLLSCEMDVRAGGRYRLVFAPASQPVEFFGTYLEVTPHARLAWTNEEAHGAGAVTTVTFEEQGGRTRLVVHELHASREAADAALASGGLDAMPETFDQLDEVLVTLLRDS